MILELISFSQTHLDSDLVLADAGLVTTLKKTHWSDSANIPNNYFDRTQKADIYYDP